MHATPVIWEIILIIAKENMITTIPSNPYLKLFLALSLFLGSPFEFMYLKPPKINITRVVSPANARIALRRFEKTAGMQLRVATSPLSPCRQPLTTVSHALNIIQEYQRER